MTRSHPLPDRQGVRRAVWQYVPAILASAAIAAAVLTFGSANLHAQYCSALDRVDMAFGDVGGGGGDATSALPVRCGQFTGSAAAFRLCIFIPAGGLPGINPRRMTNFNGSELEYDLYGDSARTQIIGGEGSGYPIPSVTILLASNGEMDASIPVYGRVHPGQSVPATFPFEDHMPGTARMRWSYNTGTTPPSVSECASGGGTGSGIAEFSVDVTARYANTCSIVGAADLDFGTVADVASEHNGTTTIEIQCPPGASWQVGLDNGLTGTAATRRMTRPDGAVLYDLFRDPGRTQRWGSSPGESSTGVGTGSVQSLTVYGMVPPQAAVDPGSYSDTITVTLTY